jgi:hypothetical protein
VSPLTVTERPASRTRWAASHSPVPLLRTRSCRCDRRACSDGPSRASFKDWQPGRKRFGANTACDYRDTSHRQLRMQARPTPSAAEFAAARWSRRSSAASASASPSSNASEPTTASPRASNRPPPRHRRPRRGCEHARVASPPSERSRTRPGMSSVDIHRKPLARLPAPQAHPWLGRRHGLSRLRPRPHPTRRHDLYAPERVRGATATTREADRARLAAVLSASYWWIHDELADRVADSAAVCCRFAGAPASGYDRRKPPRSCTCLTTSWFPLTCAVA